MPTYPESGVKLIADTAEYTKAMDDAIFLADYFDSLGTISISVSADVDTSALDSAVLPDDGETIAINIDATMTGDDLPLDGETVNYTVDATVTGDDLPLDGETVKFTADGTVEGEVADLPLQGETVKFTMDADETPATVETLNAVKTIKDLAILNTVWNITGSAVDLIGKFSEFAIAPLLSIDEAVARVNAQTASAIPNVDKLISSLYSADLGGIDQISDVVIQAKQLGAPIEEAATAALTFTKVFADQNPAQVMNTLNQLVSTGLAPNFATASDMLTVAFQNGANRAGDLLTTLNGNATALKDMGYDGQTALGLITQGLDGGYKSANDVATSLTKVKQNLTAAAGNDTADASKALESLGIPNPAETGEAWTKDFLASVISGIQNAPVSDTQKQAMLSAILGGKIGAKEFSSFMQLDPSAAAEMFAPMKGAASIAATEMDNSLSGAIADFELAAQTAAMDFLSSKQIDLPGKIQALKSGLQDALNTLANGGTLGEALTVALKPIGFDDEFQGLESALGNFVIGILQAVAQLQDLTGHGAEAAGTRATIASMGAQQLAFDLKVANPDEIASTVGVAVSRGVSDPAVQSAAQTAIDELLASGATDRAQAIVDTLRTQADTGIQLKLLPGVDESTKGLVRQQLEAFGFGTLNDDGTISMNITPGMTPESITGLANTIKDTVTGNFDAQVIEGVEIKPSISKDTINELQSTINTSKDATTQAMRDTKDASLTLTSDVNVATTAMSTQVATATTAVADLNTKVQTQGTNAGQAAPKVQQTADATKKLGDNAGRTAAQVQQTSDAMTSIAGNAPIAASGLSALDLAIQQIIATAKGLAAASDAVAQKQGQLDNQLNNTGGSSSDSAPVSDRGFATGTDSAQGTFMVGERGRELMTSNRELAVLNNMSTEAIMAALQGYIPGGSFSGKGGGNAVTINNTNLVQSQAQADAVGYRTAQQLRGMAN